MKVFPKTMLVIAMLLVGLASQQAAYAEDPRQAAQMAYEQSRSFCESGNLPAALASIRESVTLDPSNDGYWDWQGWVQYLSQQYSEGLVSGRKAVQLNQSSGDHVMICAINAQASGDLDTARQALQYAVSGRVQLRSDQQKDAITRIKALTDRTTVITWNCDPNLAGISGRPLTLAIPRSTQFQSCDYAVEGCETYKEEVQGNNRLLKLRPKGDQAFKIILTVKNKPGTYRDILAKPPSDLPIPAEVRPYLGKSDRIDPQNPEIRAIANSLNGKSDPRLRMREIVGYESKRLRYQLPPVFDSAESILRRGTTECAGWSVVTVALARASGIPAREAAVYVREESNPGKLKGHVSVEFWYNGTWIPIDPQHGATLGIVTSDTIDWCYKAPDAQWVNATTLKLGHDTPPYQEAFTAVRTLAAK